MHLILKATMSGLYFLAFSTKNGFLHSPFSDFTSKTVVLIWLLTINADIIKTHKIAGLEHCLVYKTAFEHLPDAQPKFCLHF